MDHNRNVAYSQQIRKPVELDPIREKNESLPRSGKPRDITRQLERRILRFSRRFPKFTYKKVRLGVLTTLSKASIHRILKKEGIINWICKKRPFLTLDAVETRRAWYNKKNGLKDSGQAFSSAMNVRWNEALRDDPNGPLGRPHRSGIKR